MASRMKGRHFLKLEDFSREEILLLLELSRQLKSDRAAGAEIPGLRGKAIVLIFEKTSTRTRCAFEVAAFEQGARVTYLGPGGSQMGHKESIKDTARVLGRMYDGIEYRGFGQQIVEEFARHAGVPVWNGLTDEYHPTQVLADVLTMMEHTGRPPEEISFCYLGDARNNMGNSLLAGASLLGMDIRVAAPRAFWPNPGLLERCRGRSQRIMVSEDLEKAVRGADFLYTDVWVSMGESPASWEERIRLLRPYQVNRRVVELAQNGAVKFMHCLPAFHNRATRIGAEICRKHGLDGMEVTEEVFESPCSIVFDQAENRLHTIKAILVATLGDGEPSSPRPVSRRNRRKPA
ncbi:MAG: ornithine carbamoyltransferase [Acidobacteriota bacterium]